MTTLILSAAGNLGGAVGGAFFGPLGQVLGRMGGRYLGQAINARLFAKPTKHRTVYGPQLADLSVQSSTEGVHVPRVYGRARVSGQVIWATNFEEVVTSNTVASKPKGGKGAKPAATKTTTITYTYYANFAVALCEGEVAHLGRVWADGKLLDTKSLTMRFYKGTEAQDPDPLIEAKQGGAGYAPAYRGVAYVVFEHFQLTNFGNRIPQLQFEIIRPVGALEGDIKAMTIIPGATEFGYDTTPVVRVLGVGKSTPENNHAPNAATNFEASLEELLALCPNVETISLVVPWFGDDLRVGNCTVRPKVDSAIKQTSGGSAWGVAGLNRGSAQVVSQVDGAPAYGGSPSDMSVIRCIQFLKARGLKVVFYPFVLMDIAAGNTLPDPYSAASTQAVYPWRGRITCAPAAGVSGSVDGTATATTQVDAFFGTATAAHFSVVGTTISYSGPNEWSFNRHILHSAALCKAAGGVDGFLIGSEMIGITRVRGASNSFPAVAKLKTLAAQVRAIVGAGCKLSYAADWTEYGSYVQGTNVFFPLDALWADANIDAVGIDFYAPISDWRDGDSHLDAAIATHATDPEYLKLNLGRGEAYDWYYVNDAARAVQSRTSITDGAYGKPWIYRQKDVKSWWLNAHYERIAGVEAGSPTAWVAQGKPVWFTEVGFPAVDAGTNEPSAFPDPKSSDGRLPRFSHGMRDDHTQRRGLEAFYDFYAEAGNNPTSSVYGGPMVDDRNIFPWAWDARPFPFFPTLSSVWADGGNWHSGHWLNGRLGGVPLDGLVQKVLLDYGVEDVTLDVARLRGAADGLVVDKPKSGFDVLDGLSTLHNFDVVERADGFSFYSRGQSVAVAVDAGDLVPGKNDVVMRLTQDEQGDLPAIVSITCTDVTQDFRRVSVAARKADAAGSQTLHTETAMSLSQEVAEHLAEQRLHGIWAERDHLECALPLSYLAYEPGDVVRVEAQDFEIAEISLEDRLKITAQRIDKSIFVPKKRLRVSVPSQLIATTSGAEVLLFEVPAIAVGNESNALTLAFAGFANPWASPLSVYRMVDGEAILVGNIEAPAVMGALSADLAVSDVLWRRDFAAALSVGLYGGALESVSETRLLAGSNAAALVSGTRLEFFQFQNAALVSPYNYTLSGLIRGQLGTEDEMATLWPAGSRFVMMDDLILSTTIVLDEMDAALTFKIGPSDKPYDDVSYVTQVVTLNGGYLAPLPPVHVDAVRVSSGVQISFKRRIRGQGDSWNLAEVPLVEASESYVLEILSGAVVKRTISLSSSSYLYVNADEITDFGSAQSSLSLRVAQVSPVYGAGETVSAVVAI